MTQQALQYSTNLLLGQTPEVDQKKYADLYLEFENLHRAINTLQNQLDRYTGALGEDPTYWSQTNIPDFARVQNISRLYVYANENIALGEMVYFFLAGGILKCNRAKATAFTTCARAYCSTVGGIAAGQYGEVILLGVHPYFVGLTPGSIYYLSDSVYGNVTATAPAASGSYQQPVGFALNTTTMWFNPVLLPLQVP